MSELYLKDNKVLTIRDVDGEMNSIVRVDNPELLPYFLRKDCTFEKFMDWLSKRIIPQKREGLMDTIEIFGNEWLENKNYASLSDHYWIKKRSESYKKINFFTNFYSLDVGDMMFSPWSIKKKKMNNFTPDITTNGILKKRWRQKSDKSSYLIKSGSVATHQEPLSEVLVSVLAENMKGFPCVKYDLCIEGVEMCSKCDNFITENTMLVPAYYIYYLQDKEENDNVMTHLFKMCEKFNVPDYEKFIKTMLFIDTITGNEDRNLSNIGFIMDINTMKFIGPAPLYDSGNAYWSSGSINNHVKSKEFGDIEVANMKEFKKQGCLDFLVEDNAYKEGYKNLINSYPCINDTKKENLIQAIKKRNNNLCKNKEIEYIR